MATLLFALRLWLARKIYGELAPGLVKIGSRRIIKGPCQESEAEAMEFVRNNTSIPVPAVFHTHRIESGFYIEMERVKGKNLEHVWNDLSVEQKHQLVNSLAGYVKELRALPAPAADLVASAKQHNKLRDARVGSTPFGPYSTHSDFHSLLRGHISLDKASDTFGPNVIECHVKKYQTLFTHADLSMRNIMVDNGHITAIIGWAFAGWYPEYWEFTKAHYRPCDIPDWYDLLENALARYDDELEAERVLWSKLDQPGDQHPPSTARSKAAKPQE
ncbi:hypothetical protein DIS24_g9661 [Lasiodiplodia hormozganensis]|uniref:Aminoglycoside phosphotransferase domain-containing protein n=1 Tax=Lasiodiplodia hormozganensis TaxID=869390 RepID=A0AA39XVF7_9PEZI|nr:hypothetical protein DIS24_g9661 [Lasiodiplodia hormozganensis]